MADLIDGDYTTEDADLSMDETFEYLMEEMLDNVPDEDEGGQAIDKREGSIIYNALAPVAIELTNMYDQLRVLTNDAFADTAGLDALTRRAAERGIEYRDATNAIIRIKTSPSTVDLSDCRFVIADTELAYNVTDRVDGVDDEWLAECETAGSEGNISSGDLILDEVGDDSVVDDLESAVIVSVDTMAYDAEDVETFRERYFESFSSQRFGGNIEDYKGLMLEMADVGAAKVTPHWNGGGTVKIVFVDRNYNKPEDALVQEVQTDIDPVENAGLGYGKAPIGHRVTVEAAEEVSVNVTATFTYMHGYTFADAKSSLETILKNYLLGLRKEWENGDIVLRTGAIETEFLAGTGIADCTGVTINGSAENVTLASNQIPVFGGVSDGAA